MAEDFTQYDRGTVIIGGEASYDASSGGYKIINGAREVMSAGEVVGYSKGPLKGTITVERPTPLAGHTKNQDVHDAVINQKPITVIAVSGNYKVAITGILNEIDVSWGIDKTSVQSFSLTGRVKAELF
jgi:hypothetical protein